ncbi:MAG: hypothetical protein PHE01_00260 [Methanosarcina sp.]|nr:hypothetical protein [Methanosarcina sp.]
MITPIGFGDKAFKSKSYTATVAPVDHADRVLEIRLSNPKVTPFLIKPFLKRFLIKLFLKKFAVKPFLKWL